jgi:ribonuclease BN (tRNA processing enzyme)
VGHWPHLNPSEAAKLAKEAGAKRLAMVHFDAARYLNFKQRRNAQHIARKIFKNSISAHDGLEIKV